MSSRDCQVCGKDCPEFYCFRLSVAVYKNRYGGYYWKGKQKSPKTNSGGLGESNSPMCSKDRQVVFDYSDGSTEPNV